MLKFIQVTPIGSDCTCGYCIELDKDYTVEEFIHTVLTERSDEWGYIKVYNARPLLGSASCSYKRGELTSDTIAKVLLHKRVVEVKASGGWSNMDYILKIQI